MARTAITSSSFYTLHTVGFPGAWLVMRFLVGEDDDVGSNWVTAEQVTQHAGSLLLKHDHLAAKPEHVLTKVPVKPH